MKIIFKDREELEEYEEAHCPGAIGLKEKCIKGECKQCWREAKEGMVKKRRLKKELVIEL